MKTKNIHIGGRTEVCPTDIILLKAEINYTTLYATDGGKVTVATTLKKLEERFVKTRFFYRIHKSCMVNIRFIESYENLSVKMVNNLSLTVSRRRIKNLQGILPNSKKVIRP